MNASSGGSLASVLVAAGILLIVMLLIVRSRGTALAREQLRAETLRNMLGAVPAGADIRVAADNILVAVMESIPSRGYYFYARAAQGNELVLSASRMERSYSSVGPNYSGLAEFTGTPEYTAPLTIPAANLPNKAQLISEGGYNFLLVPFGREPVVGLMRIGPLRKQIPGRHMIDVLTEAGSAGGGLISALVDKATLEDKARTLSAMAKASDAAAASALGGRQFIGTFVGLGAKLMGAPAGALITLQPGSKQAHTLFGLSAEEEREVQNNPDLGYGYAAVPQQPSIAALQDTLQASALRHLKPTSAVYFPVSREAVLVYWLIAPVNLARYTITAIESVAARISDALRNEAIYKDMSRSYLKSLQAIVAAIDSVESYTVTHSSLIAQYARGIAEEMSLAELDAVEIAAYLHDVGMSVLNEQIMFKNGRYDKNEYEEMKSHAEMGASLVASVMEPTGLPEIIRHHHERWDGWGYPFGLKGNDIPVGARIVAVADTFNAKTSSRNYRAGLPFERALADVKAAAGSQLDPAAVQAFENWWQKRRATADSSKPLDKCWVMKTCPQSISSQCPCSSSGSVCWLTPGNKCEMHGDVCANCIVRTEWESRNRPQQISIREI